MKVTNKEPVRVGIKWIDKLFEWAAARSFSTEAKRKADRYPTDGESRPGKEE
jgi:hypothetical protein